MKKTIVGALIIGGLIGGAILLTSQKRITCPPEKMAPDGKNRKNGFFPETTPVQLSFKKKVNS